MENEIILEFPKKSDHTVTRIKFLITHIDLSLLDKNFDIDVFCQKLYKYATIVIAKDGEKDIGFFAIYTNDHKTKTAHVPYFGILREYQNHIVAKKLSEYVDQCAIEEKMNQTVAEAHINNKAAIYNILRSGYVYFGQSARKDYNKYIKYYTTEMD